MDSQQFGVFLVDTSTPQPEPGSDIVNFLETWSRCRGSYESMEIFALSREEPIADVGFETSWGYFTRVESATCDANSVPELIVGAILTDFATVDNRPEFAFMIFDAPMFVEDILALESQRFPAIPRPIEEAAAEYAFELSGFEWPDEGNGTSCNGGKSGNSTHPRSLERCDDGFLQFNEEGRACIQEGVVCSKVAKHNYNAEEYTCRSNHARRANRGRGLRRVRGRRGTRRTGGVLWLLCSHRGHPR